MEMSKKKRMLVLVILSMIAGLVYLTPFLRFSFYDQMRNALGLSDVQMGTLGAVYGALNVISYIPSGFLTERFNTKKLLLVSTMGMCLTTVWYACFPGFAALIVIHALYGVFSVGTFWCPYLKAVRGLAPESEQGTIFGLSEALRGVSQTAVAFLCLGALGICSTQMLGFRVVIILNAITFALLFFAAFVLVPDLTQKSKDDVIEPVWQTMKKMIVSLKDPSIWICIFVIMCGYTLWNTVNGYIGTYCTRVLQVSESLSSTLSIIRSYIVVFVAGTTGGIVLDKFKTKGQGMMIAFVLCGAVSISLLFTENYVVICVICTILTAYFVNIIKSTYWSIMGDAGVPMESTGRATGVISLIALTPDFFTPPIISRFIEMGDKNGNIASGFHKMLFWMLAWSVLGIMASIILKRRKQVIG